MPTYDTPSPISVTVELSVGDLTLEATDRTDTVVEVRPTNPDRKVDVEAAEQTRVEYAAGRLLVRAPKSWKQYSPWGGSESVTVTIALPTGSDVHCDSGSPRCARPDGWAASTTRRASARSCSTRPVRCT